jgi:lipooligosaccharide transport system permease protein
VATAGGTRHGGTLRAAAADRERAQTGWLPVRALEFWLRVYRRTWRGTVFTGFLSPVLYLGAMGFGLGALVDRGSASGVDGVPYLQFVAPGLLAATAMQTAVGESTWSVEGAIKWQRQYHAMLATPLSVADVLYGHLAYAVLRVALASTVFLAVAAAVGAFPSWQVLLALPVAVLVGLAHAAPVFGFSAQQDGADGFNVLMRFVVVPLFLFSGTFFPIDQLPAVLHPLAWATPLWHGVSLCRDLALGRAAPGASVLHLAVMALWSLLGLVVARWSFTRRLAT